MAPVTHNFVTHTEQFIQENSPAKVLFVRSIPEMYTPQAIYNIFINFGEIARIIFISNKNSALIEFIDVYDAIQAKD